MEELKIAQLFDLTETIAAPLFMRHTYPWEVLPEIGEYILELGGTLSFDEYELVNDNIWIAKSAKVALTASITGPCIIGKNAEIRHCAFIRGNAIVGEGAVVGNSTELKNVVLFNKVQVPHYNYVGDSILGYRLTDTSRHTFYDTFYNSSKRIKILNGFFCLILYGNRSFLIRNRKRISVPFFNIKS